MTQEQLKKERPIIHLDGDTTPREAATLIMATFGATYVNQLIDALIDLFEIQPTKTKEQ